MAAFVAVAMLIVGACSGDGDAGVDPSASADAITAEASPSPSPSPTPFRTADPEGEMCLHLAEMEVRLASLQAVELRLPNRVALGIELDKLLSAYRELEDVDLGEREDELERSLTRLGYRLGELELAIEDFRTNIRPRRAAPHVEEDSQKVADELAAFVILSRC
jgi:hypothetical protein